MKALLLIDLQIDFCPGGALEVPQGDQVIDLANQLMDQFELVVATKDWHPADHESFAANHLWRRPGDVIELHGLEQILWVMHCVQDSFGSQFHPQLQTDKINHIVYKGTDKEIDSYSGFFDNGHRQATGLEAYLRDKGVTELYIMGLATDYCVKFSVLDALSCGFETYLIEDGCRGIDLTPGDVQAAMDAMVQKGAVVMQSEELLVG
ncbi:MAG: bifunctional nicotinamidase/pyrazinamidase [Bacteroidota bacterium]